MESFPGELDTLRADNARLRHLLRLTEEQARAAASDQATLTGAPTSPVTMGSSSADKVRFFLELFRCRTDVYALRWENRRDGRSGWMPAIKGYWRKGMNREDAPYLPLTPEVIDAHLRGKAHIGLYPLSDDDTCWWVAADFDKDAAMLDALAYMKAARSYGIPAALEVSQSGRGAHVWIFFAHAVSASVARSIATSYATPSSMRASAFFGVLSRIAARYWLGLTATPERRDGLEDLIYHQLGSHHVAIAQPSTGQLPVDSSDLLTPHPVLHLHPTQFQYRGDADPTAPGGMAEIYRALVADHARLDQIVADVLTAAETGANILVLTTWVDHLNAITDRLRTAGKTVTVLSGGMKARERRQIADQLANHTPDSASTDRRHQLIHRGRLRLPSPRHTIPGRTDHLQEPARPIHRPCHPALPLKDNRHRARLPRRAHPCYRLIAEETSSRLHQDGLP